MFMKNETRDAIQLKALELAHNMNIPRREFKASIGWCRRMMRRNGFSLRRRTSLAQRLPKDCEEKLVAYQRFIIKLRKQHNYLLSQVGNADETPVYFDMPSNTTVSDKGAKSVVCRTTGNEKLRVTVMLSVLADGTKLRPFVILRRKNLPKEKLPSGVVVVCQEKGWMTDQLMLEWLEKIWNRRPGAMLRQRGMLTLDSFRGHLTEAVKNKIKDLNTDLVVIPGGMTSQLQVLDVAVNKPFKDCLRQQYMDWLLSGDHTLTPTGKIRKPSVSQLLEWIVTAWRSITQESIVKGFKRCCVTNDINGTEDDILWDTEDEKGDTSSETSDSD